MSDIDREYTYGKGQGLRTYKSRPFNTEVSELMNALDNCGYPANVCFLNKYDNQHHQLGWHADDSPNIDQTKPISVISLGAEREIWWKTHDLKGNIPNDQKQLLKHGSLFVMPPGFQEIYYHRIPKHSTPCEIRISLTFRYYK